MYKICVLVNVDISSDSISLTLQSISSATFVSLAWVTLTSLQSTGKKCAAAVQHIVNVKMIVVVSFTTCLCLYAQTSNP